MPTSPTPRFGIVLPAGGDDAEIPVDLSTAFAAVEAKGAMFDQGPRSSRPSAGKPGRIYFASDIIAAFFDTGAAWHRLGIPAGAVSWFSGTSVPAGWLEANGQEVSNVGAAADLWAYMATTHGGGSAADKFLLPDLNGRGPIGRGTGTGITSRTPGTKVGAETHTLTVTEMPSHTHAAAAGQFAGFDGGSPAVTTPNTGASLVPNDAAEFTEQRGGGGAHNNMQPSLVGVYGVKL